MLFRSIEVFRHMVEGWLNSEWGKNPSMDNYQISQEDFEAGIKVLEKIAANSKKQD